MDWAELRYPQYFPPTGRTEGFASPYTYRHYGNGNYLGVSTAADDVAIYIYGTISNWQLVRVAALSDYSCLVLSPDCAVPDPPVFWSIDAVDGQVKIGFIPPSFPGGSPVIRYDASCDSDDSWHYETASAATSPIAVNLAYSGRYYCTVTATNSFGTSTGTYAFPFTPSSSHNFLITGTNAALTTVNSHCGYFAQAGYASNNVQLTSIVESTCFLGRRQFNANRVPDHPTGAFPYATVAQWSTVTTTLIPALAGSTTQIADVAGHANNGIPFVASSGESYQGGGTWNIEAVQDHVDFGLDTSFGRVIATGAYQYHGMPVGFMERFRKGMAMTLVGFAVDGFPIYARYGYSSASDADSAIKVISSSWQLKEAADDGRPSTAAVAMGTFTQDYHYVPGSGDLDECNGRFGVTPEFPAGIYHYYVTDSFPRVQRCVKGQYSP